MPTSNSVTIRSLSHWFGDGGVRKQVLFNIDLEIERGEIVILTGPSGSGKTTLLTLCGALRSIQEGSACVLGQELKGASREQMNVTRESIGFIFQAHHLLGALTARQNVALALGLDTSLSRKQRWLRAAEMLESVGLADRMDYYPESLSGGQKQRVAVARALVRSPQLVLADEPTASLDRKAGREVIGLLLRIARKQGCAILLVTHDPRILGIADRTVHLEDGALLSREPDVKTARDNELAHIIRMQSDGTLSETVASFSFLQLCDTLDRLIPELNSCLELFRGSGLDDATGMLDRFLQAVMARITPLLHAETGELHIFDSSTLGLRPHRHATETESEISPASAAEGRTFDLWLQGRTGELLGVARFKKASGDRPFDVDDSAALQAVEGGLGILLETCLTFSGRREKTLP
ncbi:MAG: ATP-binding cassette domain-containing protein [Bryobacteraceae bacterium]